MTAITEVGEAITVSQPPELAEPKLRDTPTAFAPTMVPAPIASGGAGERRYLTVMFCDLAELTAIAARLDAEEWRDLVEAFRDAASAAVIEMGGHVAQKLGDGVMALFGYPVAFENDAERAARAALAIQRALPELNRKNANSGKPALSARIALENGPVVVNTAGEIFGDAPNIAARLQALAEPGTVLVTAHLLHQIAGLFVVEERGSYPLKGVPEPVALFRLVRASGGGRRFRARQLTPLVGRDEEIAMLMRRWQRVQRGDGQLALIVGEPGLGKSRLIEEFHTRLRDTPHTWIEWNCSQLLQNTPLHPIAEWGRHRFGGGRASGAAAHRVGKLVDAGEARPGGECALTRAAARHSAAAAARTGSGAGGIAPPAIGGAHQLGAGGRAGAAGGAGVRGSALGRSDDARRAARHRRARRARAAVRRGDDAAGIPAVLGHALASRHDSLAPLDRVQVRAWWPSFPPSRAAARCGGRCCGTQRRRAAVHRGSDAASFRARRAKRRSPRFHQLYNNRSWRDLISSALRAKWRRSAP